MDFRSSNQIASAVMIGLGVTAGSCLLGNVVSAPTFPNQPSFLLPELSGQNKLSLSDLMMAADSKKGQSLAVAHCSNCHRFDKGAPTLVGPDLYGVAGSHIGEVNGFEFSRALSGLRSQTWTPDALFSWLESPSTFAPGTRMTFPGINNASQRADIVKFLQTLTDKTAEKGAEPSQ